MNNYRASSTGANQTAPQRIFYNQQQQVSASKGNFYENPIMVGADGHNTQEYENFNSFNGEKYALGRNYTRGDNYDNSNGVDLGLAGTEGNQGYSVTAQMNRGGTIGVGGGSIDHNTFMNLNPIPTQDDSRLYGNVQAMKYNNENELSPLSSQYQYAGGVNGSGIEVGEIQQQQQQRQQQPNSGIYSSSVMSQKTPNTRQRSSEKKPQERSNSAQRQRANKYAQNNAAAGGLLASPYSPGSIMTRNPLKENNTVHQVPGIDDNQSELYKDFDKCGRIQNTFMQRAAFAGIKNLNTASFRNDSPLRMVQSRFPEKYASLGTTGTHLEMGGVQTEPNVNEQDLSSYQIIQNLFPYSHQQQHQQPNELEAEVVDDNKMATLTSDNMFIIEAGFQAVSEQILQALGGIEKWLQLSLEDKLLQFASFLSNMRKDLRLGGLVGVYLIFKSNLSSIGEEIKRVIIEELFTTLSEYETQESVYMSCALEILGFLGPTDRSIQRIGIIKGLLCEPTLKNLQTACFCTLMQMGFDGFQSVMDLASKDYNSLQTFLLQNLLQIRPIQRIILVPSILTQLNISENNVKKQECVALLNRMGTLVWESGGLPIILELLEEGTVDRQLLASVLRTSGDEGEDLLIKIMRFHKNYKVRMAAASVSSYRLPINQRLLNVELKLDSNDVVQLNAIPPGQICRYMGPISSMIQDEQNRNDNELAFQDQPYVEINSRDFLASLQRMLAMTNDYFIQQFDNDEERQSIPQLKEARLLAKLNFYNVNTQLLQDTNLINSSNLGGYNSTNMMYQTQTTNNNQGGQFEKRPINDNLIKTLAYQLQKEEKAQVREVIAAAIGSIGNPEGEQCVDQLIRNLSLPDEDPNVKAMCVWAIGRLASHQTGQKAKKILVSALKDSYWKVRAAACTAVAQIGESVAQQTIPVLTKLLRDGTVNRQTIAETMINVGTLGEQTLVQILKNEPENNHKLRECIVRALALANVNNPNIDFVIEILFQTSKDKHPTVRKSSLLSLDILHKKTVNDSVTYLKARHLLPFFYRCLNDKDKQVRNCALLCIQNFGPQGELMFIEGVTKDKNYQIRCECAMGLAQIGPSTFRTLLLALHDQNPAVRDAASTAIMKHMSPEDIDDSFKSKDHQRQTIKCAIREVLSNNLILQNEIKAFLNRVLQIFDSNSLEGLVQQQQYTLQGNKENKVMGTQLQQYWKDQSYNQVRAKDTSVKQSLNSSSQQQQNMMLFNPKSGPGIVGANGKREQFSYIQNTISTGINSNIQPYQKLL